ncbi:DUF2948 family protein [Methylobacterium sp. JK268]
MELLKLAALDADDLAVISTHLQDAVLRVGDIAYLPRERRFALVARRFDWTAPERGRPQRRLTGLHFDRVLSVRCRNIPRETPEAALELLAVTFEPGEAPSGTATLVFAGGGAIRLELECVEAGMKDLGPVWEAESRPAHAVPLDAA